MVFFQQLGGPKIFPPQAFVNAKSSIWNSLRFFALLPTFHIANSSNLLIFSIYHRSYAWPSYLKYLPHICPNFFGYSLYLFLDYLFCITIYIYIFFWLLALFEEEEEDVDMKTSPVLLTLVFSA